MVPFDNGDVACIDCCKDSGEMVELDKAQPRAYLSISKVAGHYDQATEGVQELTQAELVTCPPQADSSIPKEGESSNCATRKRKSSEQSSEELLGKGVRSDVEEMVEINPPANPVTKMIIPYNNWPKISDEDLERIPRNYNSFIIPLFEKRLNHEDASTELRRILLPRVCAEVTGPQGVFIHAHDMEGSKHLLNYHVSTYHGVKEYSLTGLEDCMQAMHVEAGDTVTFCCMQPEGLWSLFGEKLLRPNHLI
ncbi:hypothetical protein RJ641_034479, partial [Dillenia turbinata]